MSFVFYSPCERLRSIIRYYWVMNAYEDFDTLTFPIGCPQFIFHRRARFYIPELDSEQAHFSISGQVNFPARIQSSGDVETIVTVFYPHTLGTLFNIPVSAFFNQEIDGYSLGDKSLNALANMVLNTDDSQEAVAMIEEWLLSRLEESSVYNFNRVGVSLKHLFLNNVVTVEDLAQRSCLSRKQFERVFFNAVGMKPKEYSNVVRFQKSLWLMQNGNRDFADIAYFCGYADQSHFIREFRRYSGKTPTALLKTESIYSDLFASPF